MLNMTGLLINAFKAPKGETKDGREYGGQHKVQVLGDVQLPNGETKKEMFTLTAHNIEHFQNLANKTISFAVGVIPSGRSVNFYIPKGTKPSIV